MSQITLDGLTKQFGDVEAVRGIDLTVESGEFLVFVGPSGCGKSTTLRTIAGLEDATEGRILIGDEDVTGLDPAERSVAMVFQNYALYPHMTAAENMTFGVRSSFESDAAMQERVQEAAETLDIPELLDRKPSELSGGERQRVAIGRALVREPAVFLLDEPLSNLDAKLRVQMRAELLELHRELETTTVYVTHDQTEAMTLGDRVAVLDDGRLQQVATPQELYDYPDNRFVAEFLGNPAMNVLSVDVVEGETTYAAEHAEFRVPLPDHRDADLSRVAGSVAQFGVRPEDISVRATESGRQTSDGTAADESATAPQTVGEATASQTVGEATASVTVTEPLGESLLLHCDVGEDSLRVKTQPRTAVSPGDTVVLGFDRDRLHLFDPDDGTTAYHSSPKGEAAPTRTVAEMQD
jgi:multiple sugar transport system ATP-binding protein